MHTERQLAIVALEKAAGDRFDILSLVFEINYNIAIQDITKYNRVKAISTAEKLKEKYPDKFKYENEYNKLMGNK